MSRKELLMMRKKGMSGPFLSRHSGIKGLSKSIGAFVSGGGGGGGGPSYDAAIIALAPIAYYRLGDAGTTAVDEMGTYDGAYVNAPVNVTPGLIPGDDAKNFNGTTQRVSLPAMGLVASSITSIVCLYKPEFKSGFGCLIDFGTAVGRRRLDTAHGATTTTLNVYNINNVVTTVLTNGTVYHIVAVIDPPGAMAYLYINGALVGSGATGNTPAYASDFSIGAHTANSYYEKGDIDEMTIFDYALTATDAADLFALTGL